MAAAGAAVSQVVTVIARSEPSHDHIRRQGTNRAGKETAKEGDRDHRDPADMPTRRALGGGVKCLRCACERESDEKRRQAGRQGRDKINAAKSSDDERSIDARRDVMGPLSFHSLFRPCCLLLLLAGPQVCRATGEASLVTGLATSKRTHLPLCRPTSRIGGPSDDETQAHKNKISPTTLIVDGCRRRADHQRHQ